MSATLSFVRAWLVGIGIFIAMTAAFCVAMIVAIAGPPTNEEMAGMRAASNTALRDLSDALARAGEDLCESFPGTVGADEFCRAGDPVQTVEADTPAAAPPPVSTETPAAPSVVVVSEVAAPAPIDPAPNLLGSPTGDIVAPPPPSQARPAHPPARRTAAHVRPRRETLARPARHRAAPAPHLEPHRPIERVQAPAAETIPAPEQAALVDIQTGPTREIAPPREDGPRQEEAPAHEHTDKQFIRDGEGRYPDPWDGRGL